MASESTELEQRVSRCEAMMAAMLITTSHEADPEDWYLLRDLLRRRSRPVNDEWISLLDRMLSRRDRVVDTDYRQRLSKFEDSFERTTSRLEELSKIVQVLQKESLQREQFARQVVRSKKPYLINKIA